MTPYERIQRNKGMEAFAFDQEKPVAAVAPFPRNNAGLAILVLALAPLLYKAMLDPSATNILGYGALSAGFGLGLWSLTKGLKNQALYDGAAAARAPKRPLKMIGAGLIGFSAASLAWFQGGEVFQALAVMVVTFLASTVAFGRDPARDKGFDTAEQRHSYKLDDLTARVGKQMERAREAAAIHADPDVMPRLRAFDDAVERLLRAAMQDPERLNSLRKFFGVYLDGAAEASERFASVYSGTGDPETKQKYLGLLEKLANAFDSKAQDYAAGGQLKFDVQFDVLDTSLSAEMRRAG